MRSEFDITREWGELFKNGNVDEGTFEVAQQLLDELSNESPLRLRLGSELNELRAIVDNRERTSQ